MYLIWYFPILLRSVRGVYSEAGCSIRSEPPKIGEGDRRGVEICREGKKVKEMSLKGEYEEYYEDGVVDRSDHHSGTDDDDDIGMGRADNTFSSSANSSSSSSFMTSSSSSGSGESGGTIGIIPRPDPKFNHRRPSVNEEGEEAEERWDCPAYILMDEDGYEEVVEGIRIQGLSMLSVRPFFCPCHISDCVLECKQWAEEQCIEAGESVPADPHPKPPQPPRHHPLPTNTNISNRDGCIVVVEAFQVFGWSAGGADGGAGGRG